jgi:hypothetical protein
MTTTARNLLAAFEALEPTDQKQVATEILRRYAADGDLTAPELDELASDVFKSYDAEEAGSD